MQSTLTSKGQATIPKAVRDHLHLQPGDRVKFFFNPDGTVAILPILPASALYGMLRSSRPPLSLEEMDAAIAEGATVRFRHGKPVKKAG